MNGDNDGSDPAGVGSEPVLTAGELFPDIYERLRQLAHRQLAREGNQTINTTALVHEAWIKLEHRDGDAFANRDHYYGYAAVAMRHILVDHARRRNSVKRGGDQVRIDWDNPTIAADDLATSVLALDSALNDLAALDARLVRVVELRFFAGLSVDEVGRILGVTGRSIIRDWQKARLFLHAAMDGAA